MKAFLFLMIALLSISFANGQQANNRKTTKQVEIEPQAHLKLYPTTADKYVNIYVTYIEPTDCTITILPTSLTLEKKWDLKAVTSHQQSLDVTQLPVGSYTIVLNGGGREERSSFSVKR